MLPPPWRRVKLSESSTMMTGQTVDGGDRFEGAVDVLKHLARGSFQVDAVERGSDFASE